MYTSIRTVGRSILCNRSSMSIHHPLLARLSASYGSAALSKEDIEKRVLEVLKGFDKVKSDKVQRHVLTF